LISFALILAGAIGNIIDSAFYGLIFSESYHGHIATLFPEDGGYAGFLHGKVVDMLYFPLFRGHFPDWFPFWGGNSFLFFRPVFNIADMSITIGVASIILFHRSFFSTQEKKEDIDSIEKTHSGPNEKNTEHINNPKQDIPKSEHPAQ
jgi:signal peptidase II